MLIFPVFQVLKMRSFHSVLKSHTHHQVALTVQYLGGRELNHWSQKYTNTIRFPTIYDIAGSVILMLTTFCVLEALLRVLEALLSILLFVFVNN